MLFGLQVIKVRYNGYPLTKFLLNVNVMQAYVVLFQIDPYSPGFRLVTDGQLPLRQCLHPEAWRKDIELPYYYTMFHDLRKEVARFVGKPDEAPQSVSEMLERILFIQCLITFSVYMCDLVVSTKECFAKSAIYSTHYKKSFLLFSLWILVDHLFSIESKELLHRLFRLNYANSMSKSILVSISLAISFP